MNASSNSLSLSLDTDMTRTTTAWDAGYDNTNLMLTDLEREHTRSVSESDGVTLVDVAAIAASVVDDLPTSPIRSPAVRKRRVYNVFGLLTNRYLRTRKTKVSTASPSSPSKAKKPKKAKLFKYKGEMLNNPQDQFVLQCVTRLQMFGANNIRDAALIVEREWRAQGVCEDKMPQYECPDKHTLVVRESTVWLAEHEPERLAQYLTDRKLGIALPF